MLVFETTSAQQEESILLAAINLHIAKSIIL